ncbi:subtilisin-like protein [Apiospora marii]|uniref:Subtilisin-like protein n=1 Tax=Apiospora marii TaxID=335849 RepID=A0ABR1SGU6_9PEZI
MNPLDSSRRYNFIAVASEAEPHVYSVLGCWNIGTIDSVIASALEAQADSVDVGSLSNNFGQQSPYGNDRFAELERAVITAIVAAGSPNGFSKCTLALCDAGQISKLSSIPNANAVSNKNFPLV